MSFDMSEMFISVAMLLNTVGRQYNAVLTAEFDKNGIFYFTENILYLVIHNDRLGFECFLIICGILNFNFYRVFTICYGNLQIFHSRENEMDSFMVKSYVLRAC